MKTAEKATECMAEYQAILTEYKEKAMELTTDNPDWTRINTGLAGWYEIEILMAKMGLAGGERTVSTLRCLASVVYAMGYDRAVSELIVGPIEKEKKN